MLPKHVANAHQKDIHYHDLDYSPYTPLTNCCLIDFKGMLENGLRLEMQSEESQVYPDCDSSNFWNHR